MTATMVGDADDLDAAVEVGAGQAECVIVSMANGADGQPTSRRYELKHVSGRTVKLEMDAHGPTVKATCSVQPLGDAKLERRILDRVRVRLEDLKGREWAPIRE